MFYKDINLFRALAIFFVVSTHCLSMPIFNFKNDSIQYQIIVYLFSGSTSFFVFILGFVFFANYNSDFKYTSFLYKKLKFVLLPYLVFSHFDVLYYTFISLSSHLLGRYYDKSLLIDYPYFGALFFGDSSIPIGLWFIPVVMIIYLLLPCITIMARASRFKKIIGVLLLTFMASLIHRNFDNSVIGLLSNVFYFLPFLILGIFFSVDYFNLMKFNSWIVYIILSFIVIISFLMQCEVDQLIKYNGKLILSNFDFGIYQKLSLTVLLFLVFTRFKNLNCSFFHKVGNLSFGIFFIHGIVVYFINTFLRNIPFKYTTDSLWVYMLMSIFVLIISFLIVNIVRKIVGVNSKFYIGC